MQWNKNIMKTERSTYENNIIMLDVVRYQNSKIFTPGRVLQHKIQDGYFNSIPVFAIGNDNQSIRWAKINKNYLKKINAIGIGVNIEDIAIIEKLEKEIGMPITATNLNGLEEIIGTTHYPFLIKNGWIFQ